jgi:TetR/AcrR family transcriptional regulator, transcriptional repressor for nem operon
MDTDGATEILRGTHQALCKHGYANLTLQDIAAEMDKSKATIHYYYDGKADLFTAFLEFLYDQYVERIKSIPGDNPRERLRSLLNVLLAAGDASLDKEFRTAMLEVRAQAPYDDEIQAQLVKFDEFLYQELRTIIAEGIDSGVFDEHVDPELTAELLMATVSGAHTRHVAIDSPMDRLHKGVQQYIETQLVVDEAPEVTH